MYNPNTEKEKFSTWEKVNLMLEMFNDLENKIITFGGDFNLFLDSVLAPEGGRPGLKKASVSKPIEILKKCNLYDIWSARNTKEKHFIFRQKHCSGFLQRRLDYFVFQMTCRNQLKIPKLYLRYLLITPHFCFL